jgi:hypothetical protein
MSEKKQNTKKSAKNVVVEPKKAEVFNVEALTETVKETLSTDRRSNTARAARAILLFAESAAMTKEQIVKTVAELFAERLSEVTIRTLFSDAHNSKYALKYVDNVIVTDRDTKIVSVKS